MSKLGVGLGLLVAATALLISTGCTTQQPIELDVLAQDIYHNLMCPLCPGQTIEQSQSELSAQMRFVVREKLAQGETKEEILQFFVERYGESVLAAPVKSGFNLIVWLTPVLSILVGGATLWIVIRRWVRSRNTDSAGLLSRDSDDSHDEKYRDQLDEDLKGFEDRGFR